jgi:hypothetical protein
MIYEFCFQQRLVRPTLTLSNTMTYEFCFQQRLVRPTLTLSNTMIYEFYFQQRLVLPTLKPIKCCNIWVLFPAAVRSPNSKNCQMLRYMSSVSSSGSFAPLKPCQILRCMGSVPSRVLVAQCQLAPNNIVAHSFNILHNRCIVTQILRQWNHQHVIIYWYTAGI